MRHQATLPQHMWSILALAAPIALSFIGQKAINVTNAILLGSLGAKELAAGSLATVMFFTLLSVVNGLMSSLTVLVANAQGAQREHEIPVIYGSGMLLSLLMSIPIFIFMTYFAPILLLFGTEAELVQNVKISSDVLRWGAPGGLLGIGLMRAFLPTVKGERLMLLVSLGAMIFNWALGYCFLHGLFGIPRMGLIGPAMAATATLWISAVVLLLFVHRLKVYQKFVGRFRADMSMIRRLFGLGWPVSVALGFEATVFIAVGIRIGIVDPQGMAAHQIAFNIADAIFTLPLSIALASYVRVGYWDGAGKPTEMIRAGYAGLIIGAAVMLSTATLLILAPGAIVGFFLDVSSPKNTEAVLITLDLLVITALFQLGDGLQTIAASNLRGLKDTKVPMLIAALGYWGIGFTVGNYLSQSRGLGAKGMWIGLAIGMTLVAGTLIIRFQVKGRALVRASQNDLNLVTTSA